MPRRAEPPTSAMPRMTTRSGASSGAGAHADLRLRRDSTADLDRDSTDSTDSEHDRPTPSKAGRVSEGGLLHSEEKTIKESGSFRIKPSQWICTKRNLIAIITITAVVTIYLGKTDTRGAQLEGSIRLMQKEFPNQSSETWGGISSILESVVSGGSTCPKAFLLLDKGDEQSRATSACLIAKVANSSSHILRNGMDPLKLSSEDLGNLANVKNDIKSHDVIVIEHLENLPTESAKSLHYICDEHDDSFGKAAYFLTLTVKNVEKSPTLSAESTLRSLWTEVGHDGIEALISRITSLAVFVNPEASIKC